MILIRFKKAFLLLIIVIFPHLSCTNPFTTREPEDPESTRQSWVQPRDPENVLDNLRNAVIEQNTENYLRSLSDTSKSLPPFRFIPEPTIAAENPGFFEFWTRDNERLYFNTLKELTPNDSLHVLTFQDKRINSLGVDSTLVIANYVLRINHIQQNDGVPAETRGEARFTMYKDTFGDWSVVRWEDRAVEEKPVWTLLKANYGK